MMSTHTGDKQMHKLIADHLHKNRRAGSRSTAPSPRAPGARLPRLLPQRRVGERGHGDGVVGVGVQAGLHAQAQRRQHGLHGCARQRRRRPHHPLPQPLRRAFRSHTAGSLTASHAAANPDPKTLPMWQ